MSPGGLCRNRYPLPLRCVLRQPCARPGRCLRRARAARPLYRASARLPASSGCLAACRLWRVCSFRRPGRASPLRPCRFRLLPAAPLAGFLPPGRRSSPGSRDDRRRAAAGRKTYARGPQKTGTCAAPCHCESNPGAARLPCRAPSLRRPAGVVRSARLVSGRPLVIRSPTTPLRRSGLADRALRVRLRCLARVSVGRGALLLLVVPLLPALVLCSLLVVLACACDVLVAHIANPFRIFGL